MDKNSDHNNCIVNKKLLSGNLIDFEEYYLINSNVIFKIIVGKKDEGIIIKSKNYVITFNKNDFSSLMNNDIYTLDEIYNYIKNTFINNKVIIKNIIFNKIMILTMKTNINKIEENIEFILEYNPNNKDFNYIELNNNYNKAINKIENLENEINKLKNELESLKLYYKNKNPIDIQALPELTKESYSDDLSDNTFSIFESIQKYFYLIFSNKNKSIICYDLMEEKIVIELKNCHKEHITNFRHFSDKKNKRDLILSLSYMDKNIKLWDVINWECILNLENIYDNGYIYSACFLNDNDTNNSYILTSNCNTYGDSDPIKVYDFNGHKVKEIRDSDESTSFIDTYYEIKTSKCYIITGNSNYVKSYDYAKNEEFQKYSDNYNNNHLSVIINDAEEIIKLIESCYDGYIRVWNFYSGALLNKIKIGDWIYGICLWNNNYLFVGCADKSIKLIDIINGYIARYLKGHNNSVLTIKKINHPKYGECLISQGLMKIKLKYG